MSALLIFVAVPLAITCIGVLLAIALGGPATPPAMPSINNPFKDIDHSNLPASERYVARDGQRLAFRRYAAAPEFHGAQRGSVVLVHGSSASSSSMHTLGQAFAAEGFGVYALDVRGHGESGAKGHIAYVGQLECDLEDFMTAVRPQQSVTLVGFSSGGGFVLRVASSEQRALFANYLLMAPFLGQDAPTSRPNSGGWVRVGVPRLVGVMMLKAIGIRLFDRLPVTRFALSDEARPLLTPEYSYALAQNFRPVRDYRASIRDISQPMRIVVGADDEAFVADRYAEVFAREAKDVPVTAVPGVGHIPLTLTPAGTRAAVAAVLALSA